MNTVITPKTSVATGSGSVGAGARHIEFILSTDFVGTINGAVFDNTVSTSSVSVYPLDAPPGSTFGVIPYTISAGSARLTTF